MAYVAVNDAQEARTADRTPIRMNGQQVNIDDVLAGDDNSTIEPAPTRNRRPQVAPPTGLDPQSGSSTNEVPRPVPLRPSPLPTSRPIAHSAIQPNYRQPLQPDRIEPTQPIIIREGDAILVERNPDRLAGAPDFNRMTATQLQQYELMIENSYRQLRTANAGRLDLVEMPAHGTVQERYLIYKHGRQLIEQQNTSNIMLTVIKGVYIGIAAAEWWMFGIDPKAFTDHMKNSIENIKPYLLDTGELSLTESMASASPLTKVIGLIAIDAVIFLFMGLAGKSTMAAMVAAPIGAAYTGNTAPLAGLANLVGSLFGRGNAAAAASNPASAPPPPPTHVGSMPDPTE